MFLHMAGWAWHGKGSGSICKSLWGMVQVVLTMDEVMAAVLSSSFFDLNEQQPGWGAGRKAPTAFKDVGQYVRLFKDLLLQELQAHLLQVPSLAPSSGFTVEDMSKEAVSICVLSQ